MRTGIDLPQLLQPTCIPDDNAAIDVRRSKSLQRTMGIYGHVFKHPQGAKHTRSLRAVGCADRYCTLAP
jgi:hypothetical protein